MRITKEGDFKRPFEGKWECDYCGTEWVMDGTDEEPATETDVENGLPGHYMPCPKCGLPVYRVAPKLADVPV